MESEVEMHFGRCRCCLDYGYLKNMWSEYSWQGQMEIYGEMLIKCYSIIWEHQESEEYNKICEQCIPRLRDACEFRDMVIKSQKLIINQVQDPAIKIEKSDLTDNEEEKIVEYVDMKDSEHYEEIEYLDHKTGAVMIGQKGKNKSSKSKKLAKRKLASNIENAVSTEIVEHSAGTQDESDLKIISENGEITTEIKVEYVHMDDQEVVDDSHCTELIDGHYEEVEYLVEDAKEVDQDELSDTDPISFETDASNEKKKWPKKLPTRQRNRRYLQYTEDAMRRAIEAVKLEKMSVMEASQYFTVPRKTLAAKLRSMIDHLENDPDREHAFKYIQEIKTILSFSNATPYKSKICKYYCMYCLDGVLFEDPAELRCHTRLKHIDERTKNIDTVMRPHSMNEILKLDVFNLICVVCCIPMDDWNGFFQHLKSQHEIEFEIAHRRVIPYILSEEHECFLCKQQFHNYVQLDIHMNTHYDNYMCGDCGDTFLTSVRLKSHLKKHGVSKFPCPTCGKIFTQENYMKRHEALVHKSTYFFKCVYCAEKFTSDRSRKNHIIESHSEKMKEISCELCGKVFTWRQYYVSHLRKVHGDKRYGCKVCDKRFFRNENLANHVASKHMGVKRYECPVCQKRYASRPALVSHIKTHAREMVQMSSA